MSEGHTKERLKELQALPLERKVGFTLARICEWYTRHNGQCYVSFSGGKDSTVLLYLARGMFPDIKAVFVDTGLEYPEIREFVKTFDNVDIVRPTINFKEVIETYGYPVIGKSVSHKLAIARKSPHGKTALHFDAYRYREVSSTERFNYSRFAYLLNAPFKISDYCCDAMKKSPMKKYQKKTGLYPIIGTMTEESQLRETAWLKSGCNSFDSKRPMSKPMSFWTEQDVLQYIKLKNIPIASVYGNVEQDNQGKYYTTGCKRTGCVFCLFGITKDGTPNRIQRLAETHPKLYDYCLNKLGLKEVMDFIGVPYTPVTDLFNSSIIKPCNYICSSPLPTDEYMCEKQK